MHDTRKKILDVQNLSVHFQGLERSVVAVKNLSFHVGRGEILGIVGESGCGKSVTSLAIMGLLGKSAKIATGAILLEGEDLLRKPEAELRKIRGNKVSMIFQEPMTSLNPVFSVGQQIIEPIVLHQKKSKNQARADAIELLKLVQISDPERRLNNYPHELSGGMRQRVMIAMALACQPDVLIADEPTTALDVTIQAQILDILRDIRQRLGTAIILITHDLGVVAEACERVMVMYAGQKIEEGRVAEVLFQPSHPYTQALIHSLPAYSDFQGESTRLVELPGIVPTMTPDSQGCPFYSRCSQALDACASRALTELAVGGTHRIWCRDGLPGH
ncbi:ABC transporter ATP-binding protein [Paralcaligenes sp. KSB-10]|uniref:ABC transporter ATP-binding protein n=1 Tax=Paralcaligenes sp. KSB-10 TaxID=2901142 RepID=UPI001E589CE7|nr:ABC transporter ATP-binding protein [Paralcaligenes sp. KSB-10]UHL64088.1 ABC transporter ATP-binding protein [Paralcaligenes sp. KSB-10]